MLFAGDTAGKISCWDVTSLLWNYTKEHCKLTGEEDKTVKNKSDKGSSNDFGVETLASNDDETSNKESEKTVLESSASVEMFDRTLESIASQHVTESCTEDSIKVVEHEDNSGAMPYVNESVTNDDNSLAENRGPLLSGQMDLKVAYTNVETSIISETPPQSGLNDEDDQELNGKLADRIDFSCLPLVPVFLDLPTHVFKAHQSGVNAISVVKTQGKA